MSQSPAEPVVRLTAGPLEFCATLHTEKAPRTCALFLTMLPMDSSLIHVRWSGEGTWVPMGDAALDLPPENAKRHPLPGEMILYPGGTSETEFLLAYGSVAFGSIAGPLAGNHFLTITEGVEQLPELGRLTLWEGAQTLRCELVTARP
jgi:hypothetical protein